MAFAATSVFPASGSVGGGNTVYIMGTDLDDTTEVEFDGEEALWEVQNANLLAVVVPPGSAGPANVVVTDGTTPSTLSSAYTYNAFDSSEKFGPVLNSRYRVDVNLGTIAAPIWEELIGIQDLKPAVDPTKQPDDDYSQGIWMSEVITGLTWGLEIKLRRRKGLVSGIYHPAQEKLRTTAEKAGSEGLVQIRYYDTDNGPDTYRGMVSVGWSPDGGDKTTLDVVTVTLAGNGEREVVPNPAA